MSMPSFYELITIGPKPQNEIEDAFVEAMDNEWARRAFIDGEWLPNPWGNYSFEASLIKASLAFPKYKVIVYEKVEGEGCNKYDCKNGKLTCTPGKIVFPSCNRMKFNSEKGKFEY